ncbi:MAG: hypothetical protein K0V04_27460 [Deltaproteobacteria bacterium]|nr:hypothetical protein [Deltaproteobacteria bacterium]
MVVRALNLVLVAAAGAGLGACLGPSVFRCTTNDNCLSRGLQGVCQPTGFCSYPTEDCDSGQRYDEYAGGGLAGACLEPMDDGGGGSSDGSSTSMNDTGSGGSDTTDTDGCPPVVVCQDFDGDGYGQGQDCRGPDCDDDNPAHHDACIYLSPDGDDRGAGTRRDPWLTFERALPQLQPGQSLVLLDGEYAPSTTGLPNIDCSARGNAVSGTAEEPISIRAESERQAVLAGDGTVGAFEIDGCQHWRILGLRGHEADLPPSDGGQQTYAFSIRDSTDIVARRLLFSYSNRYFNNHLYGVLGSARVLVEESEAYSFHRNGFLLDSSQEVTLRRCYAHGGGHEDLAPCPDPAPVDPPFCSSTPGAGDVGFGTFRDVTFSRFENCIAEGPMGAGVQIGADCSDNLAIGNATVGVINGYVVGGNNGLSSERNAVVDSIAVASTGYGVYFRSAIASAVDGFTTVDAQAGGMSADEQPGVLCEQFDGGCSVEARHVLALRSGGTGISVTGHDSWLVERSNAFDSGFTDYEAAEEIGDERGNVRSSMSIDAGSVGVGARQCVAFLPDDSPLRGAGFDGDDIGAEILYRVEGELTDVPLWNPATGAFPCGAVVPGVNDDPAVSCTGVSTRLNVQSGGCDLPADYGAVDDPCG